MSFRLRCDSCGFTDKLAEEIDTYAIAKDHEERHPKHFVFIEQEFPE